MKAILFDLDDTLIAWNGVEAKVLKRVSQFLSVRDETVSEEVIHKTLGAIFIDTRDALNHGRLTFNDLSQPIKEALVEIGIPDDVGDLVIPMCVEFLLSLTTPYDDWALLKHFKSSYKLGVISNGPSDLQRRKIDVCGFDGIFDLIMCSADIGVCKPEPMIYIRAADMLGVSLGECYMVGNNIHKDVIAPSQLGMSGVLLLRDPRLYNQDTWNGPYINSLRELSTLLSQAIV